MNEKLVCIVTTELIIYPEHRVSCRCNYTTTEVVFNRHSCPGASVLNNASPTVPVFTRIQRNLPLNLSSPMRSTN